MKLGRKTALFAALTLVLLTLLVLIYYGGLHASERRYDHARHGSNETRQSTGEGPERREVAAGGDRGCGVIIPYYVYPNPEDYEKIISASTRSGGVEFIVIVNPMNGPGREPDENYRRMIAAFKRANITVVGYLYTRYTRRPLSKVLADIDRYGSWYSQLDGIFVDEFPDTFSEKTLDYYGKIREHARQAGFQLVVANPGTLVQESLLNQGLADIFVLWENNRPPRLDDLAIYEGYRQKIAVLVYGQDRLDENLLCGVASHARWVYFTDDRPPNPWDSLPGFFDEMVEKLEKCSSCYASGGG